MRRTDRGRIWRSVCGIVAGAFLAVPACSDDGSSPEEEACGRFAEQVCAKERCCAPDQFDVFWGDDATCRAGEARNCRTILRANGVSDTPDSLTNCARELEAIGCEMPVPAVCRPRGKLESGSVCAFDDQCKNATCLVVPGEFCGSCATNSRKPDTSLRETLPNLGEWLSRPMEKRRVFSAAAEGERVAPAPASCVTPTSALPREGEPCPGGVCNGSAICGVDQKCVRRPREGESCQGSCVPPALCLEVAMSDKSKCGVLETSLCK